MSDAPVGSRWVCGSEAVAVAVVGQPEGSWIRLRPSSLSALRPSKRRRWGSSRAKLVEYRAVRG
jgi:hypothetical protein